MCLSNVKMKLFIYIYTVACMIFMYHKDLRYTISSFRVYSWLGFVVFVAHAFLNSFKRGNINNADCRKYILSWYPL